MEANAQLSLVRQALQALYAAHDGATRKAADNWLQNFRNSAGSWQLCLALLSRPGLADYEYHFAAHSLRLACCKVPEVLESAVLQGLAVQLAALLLASVHGGAWPVAGQLSSALAALAVRALCWEEETLVPQLLSLLTPQVAAAMVADLALGSAALGVGVGAGMVGGGLPSGASVVAAAVGAEASGVYALLQVLTCLPEACIARSVSAHPHRKARVASALAADATLVALLRATVVGDGRVLAAAAAAASGLAVAPLALGQPPQSVAALAAAMAGGGGLSRSSVLRKAGLQLLHSWAEQLGAAPRSLEHEAEVISALYETLVTADTASLAAESLCALLSTCAPLYGRDAAAVLDDGYQSDASSSSAGMTTMLDPAGHRGAGHAAPSPTPGQGGQRRGNWSETPGFRKSRPQGHGHGGGGGAAAAGGGSRAWRVTSPLAALGSSPEHQLASALLLQRLLDGLQTLLRGAAVVFGEQQAVLVAGGRQVAASDADADAAAAAATLGASDRVFWSRWSDSSILQAVCSVLCSAAAAVLPAALRGDSGLQARFNVLWPQLMALLGHSDPEVALSCVSFWQDIYLAQLMQACAAATTPVSGSQGQAPGPGPCGLSLKRQPAQPQQSAPLQSQGPPQRALLLQSHLPLLAQLLAGLVSRAALSPAAAAVATADARDLPEEVRMVRRELGATMRDLVGLVGLGHVAAFLERMVSEHAAQLHALWGGADAVGSGSSGGSAAGGGAAAGRGSAGTGAIAWTRLESSLYAANVALCSSAGGGGAGAGASSGSCGGRAGGQGGGHPSAVPYPRTGGQGGGHPSAVPYPSSPSPGPAAGDAPDISAAFTLPLVDDAHIASIIATAAGAVVHPASSLKLSGTALTLVGGMAAWFAAHPEELARPLDAVRAALGSLDEKLARNAATALNRLSAHDGCATLLLGRYSNWVAGLCGLLPGPEVTLRHKPAPGLDMTSRELLVASLMRLACSSSNPHLPLPQLQPQAASVQAAAAATSQLLLQQLLAPRVVAAAAELERLAGSLMSASASGALQAHLQMWRVSCQQYHGHAVQGVDQGVVALEELQRAPLCRPGVPLELQRLGVAAMTAAQRLAGLASALLFVPSAGQVQDMGAGSAAGVRRGGGGGGGVGDGGAAGATRAEPEGNAAAAAAAAAAATVVAFVVQAVRTVWPNLLACLQPGHRGEGSAAGGVCACGGSGMLLETQEGAQLLPAACSLLQGALLVAAAASAGATGEYACGQPAGLVDLLSSAMCLLTVSQGTLPVAPTEQQLQMQQWPANLDWPNLEAAPVGRAGRSAAQQLQQQQQQQGLKVHLWLGPPVSVLQLVLGCLPVCGALLAPSGMRLPQQQQQQEQAEGQQAAEVAEQVVRAACVIVRQACVSLQAPSRSGGATPSLGPDTERILQVLPVLQALLLHTPQALGASRELLECVVAATVSCMICQEPEACRSVLEWAQLLMSCAAFAPATASDTGPGATSMVLAALAAAAAGGGGGSGDPSTLSRASSCEPSPGSGAAVTGGRQPHPQLEGARGGGGGGGSGFACLLARCRCAPALERSYAGVAAQLDAPCACCAPNSCGLVFTVAAVETGVGAVSECGGGARARHHHDPYQPFALLNLLLQQEQQRQRQCSVTMAAAAGNLGAVVVLSLMVAAAGGMPPDLMLPISTCLHNAWQAMGSARFRAWIRKAAVDLSTPGANAGVAGSSHALAAAAASAPALGVGSFGAPMPWARLKPDALSTALLELWSDDCERDVMKFKRALKALCGGKKKGA